MLHLSLLPQFVDPERGHVRCGVRQSIAFQQHQQLGRVTVTEPSIVTSLTKRPFSNRLANSQKPCPSQ